MTTCTASPPTPRIEGLDWALMAALPPAMLAEREFDSEPDVSDQAPTTDTLPTEVLWAPAVFETAAAVPTIVTDYTAILGGSIWSDGDTGKGFFYTYSFSTAAPAEHIATYGSAALTTFQPFTEEQRALARTALDA